MAALLDGVTRIAAPGVPGPLCVFGDGAFPVVTGGCSGASRAPVVAAARWGRGRVVVFGHTGYFDEDTLRAGGTGELMRNAIRWAAGKPAAGGIPPRVPVTSSVGKGEGKAGDGVASLPRVAVLHQRGLLGYLKGHDWPAEEPEGSDWPQKLQGYAILCLNPHSLHTDEQIAAVARFVKAGGGLVMADLGWGWLQLHPGQNLLEHHAGNRLLGPAGIVWADGYLDRTADIGFAASPRPSPLTHGSRALEALIAHDTGKAKLTGSEVAQAVWTLTTAARSLPRGDTLLLPKLRQLEQDRTLAAVPTSSKPLTAASSLARVLLTLQLTELPSLPPEKVQAHPAAAAFPGPVPADAKRVSRTLDVDTSVPDWHSTGLYAAPGEVVTIQVPPQAADKGLFLRIGAHDDTLWDHDSWSRCPEICSRHPLKAASTRAANAFGGLVYVEVLGGCHLGVISVTISGVVEAPFFVRGKTTPAEWRLVTRHLPAPWAELAGKRVIITLPSEFVRTLEDPEDLMAFWDKVLDSCGELAARPLDGQRPERYVTDVQISAGYMHSGYPVMTFLDVAPVFVDKACLLREGHDGVWGLFHEMGHNFQVGDWTFDGTGEVTENLFTLYVLDKVCGTPPSKHPRVSGKEREKLIKTYFAAGRDFERWKDDPFIALVMYVQMQEAFGWEAFTKVFAEYRRLPGRERPRNDDQKRDQWLVRFSRAVGRNLGAFFQAWGVPTSERARASLVDLPSWMPDGFPPK
jgi:hypothetical protein